MGVVHESVENAVSYGSRSCTLFAAFLRLAPEVGAGFVGIHVLAAVQRGQAAAEFAVELAELVCTGALVFFQEAKSFAQDSEV